MSVLVKGMKMPGKCTACEYFYYEPLFGIQRCKLTNLFIEGYSGDFPGSCPLVELPEKHGDLIDREALCDDLTRFYENKATARGLIYEQPTVIEAEDGTCTM